MDWVSLASSLGINSVLLAIIAAIQSRRINKATADNSVADYSSKVIASTDQLMKQMSDDRYRAFAERDKIESDRDAERNEKNRWRDDYYREVAAHQQTKTELLKSQHQTEVEAWHKCEVSWSDCQKRIPPRKVGIDLNPQR